MKPTIKSLVGLLTLIALVTVFVSFATAQESKKGDTKKDSDDYYEEEQAGGVDYEEAATVLDKQDIIRVIKKKYTAIRSCYETVLQTNQKLKGRLVVSFDIQTSGKVSGVKKGKGSTMKDKKVVKCVLDHIRSLNFPERKKGEVQTVNFPFNFQPKAN